MPFGSAWTAGVPEETKMTKPAKTTVLYVRIEQSLHRQARVRALTEGLPLAHVIEAALAQYLARQVTP